MKTRNANLITGGLFLIVFFILTQGVQARKIMVGPSAKYKTPSEASKVAKDGDSILIQSGVYARDVAYWKANNLFISGVGGLAHLKSGGRAAGRKAIWVIQGNNTTIEYIEFSECKVGDHNGAGIRQEGAHLTVRHCYFHDNEEGILAGDNAGSKIRIEYCEFARNGYGKGYTHHIYINHVDSCIVRYSYFHHANIGHHIKSRAHNTLIAYNRVEDEKSGNSSRLIDIPNGGSAVVIGNYLQQGPRAENSNLVEYGLEGLTNPGDRTLYMVHNTMVNERHASLFVQLQKGADAYMVNNVFVGKGTMISGKTLLSSHNYKDPTIGSAGFTDPANYDYSLQKSSPLVDAGTRVYKLPGGIKVKQQYIHPAKGMIRPNNPLDSVDIGAFEYQKTTRLLSQFSNVHLQLSPNPCRNGLLHFLQDIDDFELEVIDAKGRPIPFRRTGANSIRLLNGFKGMGTVAFYHSKGTNSLRFIML